MSRAIHFLQANVPKKFKPRIITCFVIFSALILGQKWSTFCRQISRKNLGPKYTLALWVFQFWFLVKSDALFAWQIYRKNLGPKSPFLLWVFQLWFWAKNYALFACKKCIALGPKTEPPKTHKTSGVFGLKFLQKICLQKVHRFWPKIRAAKNPQNEWWFWA